MGDAASARLLVQVDLEYGAILKVRKRYFYNRVIFRISELKS
jgi:hypothetical protein